MSLVVDSSVALTWCFEDERTPATQAILEQVAEHGAVAPTLWPMEVVNALMMSERKGRVTTEKRRVFTGFLRALPITLDAETTNHVWDITAALAARHRLTIYDASYLELAQRSNFPLATLDRELCQAAQAVGVAVLGLAV